jgi:hypothetical protein
MPKDPALRQRRNKASTRATLTVQVTPRKRAPSLPERGEGLTWHRLTRLWWRDVWRSPMAAEYLDADVHGLYRLAVLVDRFWTHPSVSVAQTIAHQEQRYGLSPLDRRRLEWIVEKAEQATQQRRAPEPPKPLPAADDPRKLLEVVKSDTPA